jgi:predicted membrane metal-binding protein
VGPSVSAVRAVVATALGGRGRPGRQAAPWRAWTIALLVVGAIWPGSVREAGARLSFASVAGVLLANRSRRWERGLAPAPSSHRR